ncbi:MULTISPECIES: CocE/NonD family hydrolase [unclassified Mesorhizobium]|uniref:CocE/NonD family hydrolase n=1 Tax=unclassified Mesorhizobium TaxID=325217 RepID=UPI0003CFD5D5|nr:MULTISPECIES: CocE/NonD family hydrolase [unclassified Mesorhizobium]ESZ02007.1 glutaryl 7-ACA acylase [Mesorhizobium sp. L2C089B000]WJI50374.1 CocE/NonD family hydrolase [Mesorhizobium sp. C089B]
MLAKVIENEWIHMPDGRRLAARIWLPASGEPAPAIFEYLPYLKRGGTESRDEGTHGFFAKAGYACVRVDIAGTGESEGRFDDEYSEQELNDGEAILTWIAAQAWCDGNIGMIGISWGGFNGLQMAYRRPPALKAVISMASSVDRYSDDCHFMGGCLLSDNVNWSNQLLTCLTRPADPEIRANWRDEWIARLENAPFSAVDWLRHPTRDDYWKHGSVCEDWSRILAPVLAITGWADPYVNAPPALAANVKVPCKALIGPWEHSYPHLSRIDPADFHSEAIRWFGRWLKREPNGAEDLPPYRVYMQEHFNPTKEYKLPKGRWIAERRWPSPNVSERVLFLSSGGLQDNASEETATISSPAHIGQAGGYLCPGMRINNELPGDQTVDDALSTCFDSSPLTEAMELLGRPKIKFAFSVDRPVAQIVARLCDVSPEGVSQRITYRALNLNHFASHESPQALVPGQVYEAEIELNQCAHRLKIGHVLRVALSTSYWPIVWPAPENAVITLHLDNSSLHLPVRTVIEDTPPFNPGSPVAYPTLDAAKVRPVSSSSKRRALEDGTIVLKTFDDFGEDVNPNHGMIVGSHVRMYCSIHPSDPATARFESQWHFKVKRDEWQIDISTEHNMHCDVQNFFLYGKVRATEGPEGVEVFAREWSETVPRHLL